MNNRPFIALAAVLLALTLLLPPLAVLKTPANNSPACAGNRQSAEQSGSACPPSSHGRCATRTAVGRLRNRRGETAGRGHGREAGVRATAGTASSRRCWPTSSI